MTTVRIAARPWQLPLIHHFKAGGKRAYIVGHRRSGKDRAATFIESLLMFDRVGTYWHALPEFAHARRVIWDNITNDGKRLIDESFPPETRAKTNEQEMKIEAKNGSIWQLVGADNFNRLVGPNPVHVTLSEFALMHPNARNFISPILDENNGSELLVTTPRGYNHAWRHWEIARRDPVNWYTGFHPVSQTKLIPEDRLELRRREMPDELYRQEYECDWSAANVGAVLGRYIEEAERAGRISDEVAYDEDGAQVVISSDIGFRDMATFWFWQPVHGGFNLIDYVEGIGRDADEWSVAIAERCEVSGYRLGQIWLPHDAKVKTFQSKHSSVERFIAKFGADRMRIVPQTKIADRINAARVVVKRCAFNATSCELGLAALRAWRYEWDDDQRKMSDKPVHDWSSHGGDGFSYGAQVLLERAVEPRVETPRYAVPAHYAFNLEDLYAVRDEGRGRRVR